MFLTNSKVVRGEKGVIYAHRCNLISSYDGKINFTIHMFYVTPNALKHIFTNTEIPFGMKVICDNEIDLLTFL